MYTLRLLSRTEHCRTYCCLLCACTTAADAALKKYILRPETAESFYILHQVLLLLALLLLLLHLLLPFQGAVAHRLHTIRYMLCIHVLQSVARGNGFGGL
jgi:hypothetical protein